MINKIALGTAQFGLDYGINNKRGQIPEEEVFDILKFAFQNSIDTLDTAYAYGESEEIIGRYLDSTRQPFKIITKTKHNVEGNFHIERSFQRLRQSKSYAFLVHNFGFFREHPAIINALATYRSENRIDKIGFSLYYPAEVDYLFDRNIDFDIVQVPYSIFDRRFEPYFASLKEKEVEIHVRSVFLQGLFFKKPERLTPHFMSIKDKIKTLHSIAKELDIPLSALCLGFVLLEEHVDKAVIGIDSIDHLKENVNALHHIHKVKESYSRLEKLGVTDENIILPFNWQ